LPPAVRQPIPMIATSSNCVFVKFAVGIEEAGVEEGEVEEGEVEEAEVEEEA
jgi:hypothetical protein